MAFPCEGHSAFSRAVRGLSTEERQVMFKRVTRLFGAAGMAALIFSTPCERRVAARVAHPDVIPANPIYVVSVPDTAACWAAIKGNALYDSLSKLLQQPQFAAQLDEVLRQVKDVEAGLGFGLGAESLSKVVSALDIFIEAGKTPGEVNGALVLKVADRARLNKLVALIEKAADRALAADDKGSTPSGAAAPTTSSVVMRRDRDGVMVSEYSLGQAQPVFSASDGDLYVLATSENVVLSTLRRAKAPGGGFGSRPEYKALTERLGEDGHVFIYTDQQAAATMGGPVPEEIERFQAMMREILPLGLSGNALTFNPASVVYRSYTLYSGEGEGSFAGLGTKYPADKPMEIIGYAPADSSLVLATNIFDARGILGTARSLAENLGKVDLEAQLSAADKTLGFSIAKDLVPALGNEIQLVVNSVRMSGGLPQVDAALVVGVADEQRMKNVLLAVERSLEKQMASNPLAAGGSRPGQKAPALQTMTDGPLTIRYAESPLGAGLTPCYAFDGKYLLIATSTDSLKRLVSVKSSGSGLPGSGEMKALGGKVSTQAHMFQFLNLGQMVDMALGIAEMAGANLGEVKGLISGVEVLDKAASSAVIGADGIVSDGIITLKR
jgi:hypothetical protein